MTALESRARRPNRRTVRLEYRIGPRPKQGKVSDHELAPAEFAALARAGEGISAMKKYREATGTGPLAAKEVVDRPRG
jgi:ribosomal protein L7/L12